MGCGTFLIRVSMKDRGYFTTKITKDTKVSEGRSLLRPYNFVLFVPSW